MQTCIVMPFVPPNLIEQSQFCLGGAGEAFFLRSPTRPKNSLSDYIKFSCR